MSPQDLGRAHPARRRYAWSGCLLVVGLAVVLVPGVYVSLGMGVGLAVGQPVVATLITDAVAAAAILLARRRPDWFGFDPAPAPHARVGRPGPLDLGWAFLAVVCLVLAFAAGQVAAVWIGELVGPSGFTRPSSQMSSSPVVVGVMLTLVVAPVAEEALMRGLMYPMLRQQMPPVPAALLVTLCFSALHANLTQSVATIGLGLLLALVYEHTRRLWPVVALHAGFNVLALLVSADQIGRIAHPPAVLASTLAFGVALWLLAHQAD